MHRKSHRRLLLLAIAVCAAVVSVARADNGPDHRVRQNRPIQLGTSGGNDNDINIIFCCSGTLGGLVEKNGAQYIVSNNHVLAKSNSGKAGDPVSQPGLIDKGCSRPADDVVADLTAFVTLKFKTRKSTPLNTVDAAIAKVRDGQVDTTGALLDIGTICANPLSASLNLKVKKSGRTTGLTFGTVAAVNVTVDVSGYGSCGTGTQTARFTNQIRIDGGLSQGGDSGSLVVEDAASNPKPVGLLFAGGNGTTFANRAQDVLSAFGVTFVGGSCSSAASSSAAPTIADRLAGAVARVKDRHEDFLLNLPHAVGTGVGLSQARPGELVIELYVRESNADVRRAAPAALEGVPVQIVETGEIRALPACGSCGSAAGSKSCN